MNWNKCTTVNIFPTIFPKIRGPQQAGLFLLENPQKPAAGKPLRFACIIPAVIRQLDFSCFVTFELAVFFYLNVVFWAERRDHRLSRRCVALLYACKPLVLFPSYSISQYLLYMEVLGKGTHRTWCTFEVSWPAYLSEVYEYYPVSLCKSIIAKPSNS